MKEQEKGSDSVWDCGSPLYDSYELASLSHVIDRHMMMLPSLVTSESRKLMERGKEEAVMIMDGGSPRSSRSSNSSPRELIKKKKNGGGTSWIGVSFLWSNWRRKKICDHDDGDGTEGGGMKKGKKVTNLSDGICRSYNRISSLRK